MTDADSGRRRHGFSRRRLLRGAAAAGGGLMVAGVGQHAAGQAPTEPPPLKALTRAEADLVGAMADRIFPPDEASPGAVDIGVVSYIDGQLAGAWGHGDRLYDQAPVPEPRDSGHGYQLRLTPLELYKHVLPRIDDESRRRYRKSFTQASAAQQDELLHALEDGDVDIGLADGRFGYGSSDFFTDFFANVKEGLFADPMYHGNRDVQGWRWINYPGDPMAYGDIYYATFGRADDPYVVEPKGMR